MSLAGPASPSFKHGRHSKYLPTRLGARYREGINNPELIELRSEVALIDVRISQLLEALGKTGNARLWEAASRSFDAFLLAKSKGRSAKKATDAALGEHARLLATGRTEAATWEELREALDLRRRLTDSETKRMKDLHQMISVQQAMQMMDLLISVVKTHVTDRALLAALSDQFVRLVGSGSREPAAT